MNAWCELKNGIGLWKQMRAFGNQSKNPHATKPHKKWDELTHTKRMRHLAFL